MRSNLKLRAKAEEEFLRKLSSERHRRGARETQRRMRGPIWVLRTISTAAANIWKDRNASDFASIIHHVVGITVYWGVVRRIMEGGAERGAGID